MFVILIVAISAQAETHQPTFKTPASLSKATLITNEDSLPLLLNKDFQSELYALAQQFSAASISQENMFNKIALLSIRKQHENLLKTVANFTNAITYHHYVLDSETHLALTKFSPESFNLQLTSTLNSTLMNLSDEELYQMQQALGWSVSRAQSYVHNIFKQYQNLATLTQTQAVNLVVNSHLYHVLARVIPTATQLINSENQKRYIIEPEQLITTAEGIELAATIVRKRNINKKTATALQFTIYADESAHIKTAIHAASHGYIGIVANSRGKRSSRNNITPWEYEGKDVTSVIDWIGKQPWSDKNVVMYGGSYNGFTQWAAAKHMHPNLKAIAPYTAASLITGLPYENNIVLTGNYPWAFHVTNNKTMDHSVYANWQKNNQLTEDFYKSGRAINKIDALDGKANPWFQKWLKHPSFDHFYQAMVPVKQEYANINIPVLSVTGYFDGGQISSIDYLKRHYKYNKNADHTLLIGPYNHGTAQGKPRSHHSNYKLDSVALEKDTEEIVFAWFDHLLFNKSKPKLLQNKVNYQLMGSNTWQHHPSLEKMNQQSKAFYIATTKNKQAIFELKPKQEQELAYLSQTIDLADRTTEHNIEPWPVISSQLNEANGLVLMTDVFEQAQELAGSITGHFSIAINKKDVDIGYNFYEIDENGKAFHLNNYRSRASYAENMSKRKLLTPNMKTTIPIVNARFTAKLINKGSRLAIVLNVNKNTNAQVNMGSGKDVNTESINDAGDKLVIKWFNDSQINMPLRAWKG